MVGRVTGIGRGPLALAAAVMVVGFGWAFGGPASSAQASASIELFDDDAGQALFANALDLAPGHPVAACISIGAASHTPADVVMISAAGVSGALAAELSVTVDRGTGGHFGDCTGFSGGQVFSGTLEDLAAADGGGGVTTGWHPASVGTQSFRITVLVDPALTTQGLTAQGQFVWRMVSTAPPRADPSPTPSTSPSLSSSPSVDPSSPSPTDPSPEPTTADPDPGPGPDPDPTGTGGPDSPAAPTPAPPESAVPPSTGLSGSPAATPAGPASPSATHPVPAAGPGRPPAGPAPRPPDLTIGGALARVQEVFGRAERTAANVVSSPQYPLTAISLAVGFLMIQDFIDRRDPKLAVVTRSQRDNEISFPDRSGRSPGGGPAGALRLRPRWPWDGAGVG